jgi:flagellin
MSIFVNSNLHALNAIDQNRQVSNQIATQFQRLSSGNRINSAKDDAAGLSIQTRMTASIRGTQVAQRNANDFISLFQTAEGGLGEVGNILQRIRELAVQSANLTNNDADRNALNKESIQLQAEIDKIATQTNFNQINLLDGGMLNQLAQIGYNNASLSSSRTSIDDARTSSLGGHSRIDSLTGVIVGSVEDTRIFDDGGGRSSVTFVREKRIGNRIDVTEYGIRATTTDDDTLSSNVLGFDEFSVDDLVSAQLKASSAIAKAKAINDSSEFTGIKAFVGATRTDDDYTLLDQDNFSTNILEDAGDLLLGNSGAVQAVELGRDNIMFINGVAITDVAVEDQDATGSLVDAINAQYDQTGVVASMNNRGELVLEARDGRNIAVQYRDGAGFTNDALEGLIGLRSGADATFVYGGKLTLVSEEGINVSNYNDGVVSTNEILGGLSTQKDDFGDSIFVQDQPDAADYFLFHEKTTVSDVSIDTVDNANEALTTLDFAIDQISNMRSKIGAQINRFESTINSLQIEREKLSDAVSQIGDTDFASATAVLARQQIVQQASISILAQSNFQPSLALSLL